MGVIAFRGNTGWKAAAKNKSKEKIKEILGFTDTYILDTETTGLKGDVRVIELSVIDLNGNTVFHSLFNPGMPLPEKIPELTGITDEMVSSAPYFYEKTSEIVKLLERKTVIAWNAPFDRQCLTNELLMVSQGPIAAGICWIDAMELCSYASGRARKWYKLIEAKQDHGIGENQEHRATADCLDTLAVLRRIAGFDEEEVGNDAEGISPRAEEDIQVQVSDGRERFQRQ